MKKPVIHYLTPDVKSLCGSRWNRVDTTTRRNKVTCKKCLKSLLKIFVTHLKG